MVMFKEVNYSAIAKQNGLNVENTPDGGRIQFHLAADVLVIGDIHHNDTIRWLQANLGRFFSGEGEIVVKKGRGTDQGSLTVDGVLPGAQKNFKAAVGQFSKKKVIFV